MQAARGRTFHWIFFDCFNTLLEELTDESGLCSIPARLVDAGLFRSESDFKATYLTACRTLGPNGTEVTLVQRLQYCLDNCQCKSGATLSLQDLLDPWKQEYPNFLRPAAGVREMLDHWKSHAKLAVVSNFYESGYPAHYLQSHEL